jgi:phosphatidylglycerol:prolipoprotein diacylglycerol transferase
VVPFLAIEIPWDPNITRIGGFLLTWHGLFTAIGILVGVRLSLWVAKQIGFDEDDAYTLALVGVPSGIIGARLLYVIENWSRHSDDLVQILQITEGGLSIWGGIVGGFAGALAWGLWRAYPMRAAFDMGSFGMITGMAIGRIGDLINGEHLAKATELPWGVIYTDPDSPAFAHSLLVGAHHPATTYEMIGDLVILGLLFLVFFRLGWRYRPGITFLTFAATYSVMRFFLTFLRVDSPDTYIPGLTTPQLVSIATVFAAIPVAVYFWRRPAAEADDEPARAEAQSP